MRRDAGKGISEHSSHLPPGFRRPIPQSRRRGNGQHREQCTGEINQWCRSAKPPSEPLIPSKADISAHLYALFPPEFVQPYPDSWIEIAYASPASGKMVSRHFSAFELDKAVAFAEQKNKTGHNIYVGAALRHGKTPPKSRGRASRVNIVMASHAWADFDKAGDDARIDATLKEKSLVPAIDTSRPAARRIREGIST